MEKESEKNTIQDEPQITALPLFGSCRLTITMMCMAASFGGILMTINLGMATVCLNQSKLQPVNLSDASGNCSGYSTTELETSAAETCFRDDDIHWDKDAQGMLLGATYYGMVSMQLVAGWLNDKYGRSKLQMIVGNGVMALGSLLSPVTIQYAGVPYFFALRVIQGAGMCFGLCSILPILKRWSTAKEQGLIVGLAFAGVGLANSLTYPISGFLCAYGGWKSIFYFSGACGMAWSIAAIFLIYDSPQTHPRVSAEEKQYLLSVQKKNPSKKTMAIPWRSILLSLPVWSLIITNFFFFAAQKGTIINLPLYMKDVLRFSVTENGIFSALPSVLSLIIHFIMGPLFDFVRAKNWCTVTTVRKCFHAVGTLIPAIMMFAASQLDPEQKYLIIALITVGYSFYEIAWIGGFSFCMMDIAPDYVGTIQGMNNTIGLAPGFIMPSVIALLTPNGSREEWSHVFLMFGGLYSLAFLIWTTTGSSELQSWGKVKEASETAEGRKLVA